MRKNIFAFTILLLIMNSCSTKFKVGAEYKEVTVVYGLLSMVDTAHYIKITKGYFDEEANNLELAKNPDSIFFTNLSVEMQVKNGANVIETIVLSKVDLANEGYPKDPGTFATTPNYAYKFKKNLDPKYVYKLKVKNLSTGKEIEGETPIITTANSQFSFVNPLNSFNYFLEFSNPQVPYAFQWEGPATAAFYDVVVRFKYQEVKETLAGSDTIYVIKEIPVVRNVLSTNSDMNATLSSVDFFKQLNSYIGTATTDIKRYVDTPDLVILAGGQALKTYIDVNSAQGGITFDQIKPNYTNLIGENVYGFLSTRGQIELKNIKFTGPTIDSILNGSYTKSLRLVGISNK